MSEGRSLPTVVWEKAELSMPWLMDASFKEEASTITRMLFRTSAPMPSGRV